MYRLEKGPNYEIEFDEDDIISSVHYQPPEKIKVACEHCEAVFKVGSKHIGKSTTCKICRKPLLVIWIEAPDFAAVSYKKRKPPQDNAPTLERVAYFKELADERLRFAEFCHRELHLLVAKRKLLRDAGCSDEAIAKLADPILIELDQRFLLRLGTLRNLR